jgi:hypothetical protein
MRQFSLSVASDGNADNKKMNIPAIDNKVTIGLFTIFKTLLSFQPGRSAFRGNGHLTR